MASTFLRILIALCLTAAFSAPAVAQVVPSGAVSFRNELTIPVVLQGVSQLKAGIKRGAPIVIAPGKSATEFNAPAGMRIYNVYDANQPQRVLGRNVQVAVFPGRPVVRVVRQDANMQIVVAPE